MRKSKHILYFVGFSVLTAILFFRVARNFDNQFLSVIFGLICFATLIMTGVVFFKHFAIKRIFLLFYALFGMVYMAVLPMMIVPDEPAHWLRIFEISEGHLISDKDTNLLGGRTMPEGLSLSLDVWTEKYNDMSKNYTQKISRDTQQWYNFSNTALYAPITYIFQIPGVLLGKIITARTLFVMYAGRISAFLLSLVFLFHAFKHLPCGKTMLFAITMMPMFIHQAVSLSADAMLNTISLCSVAFVLWACGTPDKPLEKKHFVAICAFALCIALSKIIYVPLVLLFCLIPSSKFGSKSQYKLFLTLLLAVSFMVSSFWFLYITKNYRYAWVETVDSGKQIANILEHPLSYTMLVIKTYVYGAKILIAECIGRALGWLNIFVNSKALILYAICLASTFFHNNEGLNLIAGRKTKLPHIGVYGLIIAVIMLLIATSEYVTWTAPYADNIAGIQGRYFIPIVFPLCLLVLLLINSVSVVLEVKYRGKVLSFKQETAFRMILPVLAFVHLLVIKQIMLFCN